MSLHDIRAMRMARKKPGIVWVVVGALRRDFQGDQIIVEVKPDAQISLIDWRPLVGLPVVIFATQSLPALTARVLTALEAAGARLFGVADETGLHPFLDTPENNQKAKLAMGSAMELLCQ